MRFDIADLRLFAAIVERGSITGGAAALNLALASASTRISGMEAVLGVPLLERGRRGVRPTEAGLVLLRHAREILARTEQMRGELRGFSRGTRGRIRLLANTGALLGFLPRILQGFLLAHPGLDIALAEHPSPEIVRLLTAGRADLGIVADVVDPGALVLHVLAEDPLVLVTGPRHRFAGRARIDFTNLLGERFIGLLDSALEQHLAEHAARRRASLSWRVHLRAVTDIGRMVEAGIGVAILPASAAGELKGAALGIIPLADAWAHRRLAVCLRAPDDLTPHARLLFAHITAAASAG